MSREYSLGHMLAVIRKDYFREDIVRSFDFDEDMNGNNGEEFLPKKVITDEYKSTIEWAIDKAIEKDGVSENALTTFLHLTIGSDSYYGEYDYEILEQNNEYHFSVAWIFGY